MRPTWIAAVVAVGVMLGVAVAGIPRRHHDTPLHVTATTTSSTPGSTTTTTTPLSPTHSPSLVTVVVVNTGGSTDSASLSRTIHGAGYSTYRVESDLNDHVTQTVVEYAPGYDGDAAAVAAAANLTGASLQPLGDSPIPSRYDESANVMVVLAST